MLRMSTVFTGANIKSTNLHYEVNNYVNNHMMRRDRPDDEDEMTLRSIKRW